MLHSDFDFLQTQGVAFEIPEKCEVTRPTGRGSKTLIVRTGFVPDLLRVKILEVNWRFLWSLVLVSDLTEVKFVTKS